MEPDRSHRRDVRVVRGPGADAWILARLARLIRRFSPALAVLLLAQAGLLLQMPPIALLSALGVLVVTLWRVRQFERGAKDR